ncbi:MAG: hypothetical protein GY940_11930 [bacterium]|nr:hypothetical protein [bacterium]
MKKLKLIMLIVLIVVVLFGIVFLGLNLTDGPEVRFQVKGADQMDESSFQAFSVGLVGKPNFEYNNAYYRMWTLSAPVNVDIESEELLLNYRRLHDPKYDNDRYLKEWHTNPGNWRTGKQSDDHFSEYSAKRKELLDKHGTFDSWGGSKDRDWGQFLLSRKDAAVELINLSGVFLERYRKIVYSEVFEDFTIIRMDAVVPSFLAWLRVALLFNTVNMLDAMEGQWEKGVTGLLDHVNMVKKAMRCRTLIFNLLAKAIMRESLCALASLMNQPEFPSSLFEKVALGLPPLKNEEFSSRVPMLLEAFHASRIKAGNLFFQKNRTQKYYNDLLSNLANRELIPPYQWKSDPLDYKKVKSGWFWWMRNPAGKAAFEEFANSKTIRNLYTVTFKSYALKAVYDMTRISAELHRHYSPGKPVEETLESIDTYRQWLDPGSGKPYKWHEQKQMLYSFGADRDDDGGRATYSSIDTDITLPVVLYIKN